MSQKESASPKSALAQQNLAPPSSGAVPKKSPASSDIDNKATPRGDTSAEEAKKEQNGVKLGHYPNAMLGGKVAVPFDVGTTNGKMTFNGWPKMKIMDQIYVGKNDVY